MLKKVEAVEIYELRKSTWSGDEYEGSKDSLINRFPRRYLAERELKRVVHNVKNTEYLSYYISPVLLKPDEAKNIFKEFAGVKELPEYFRHIEDIPALEDACGQIKELYKSEGMSLAYAIVKGKAKPHKHNVMEEVYYVVKGQGSLNINKETYPVEEGDTISIPKNSWHYLESKKDESLEVLVATHPKFMPDDVILE